MSRLDGLCVVGCDRFLMSRFAPQIVTRRNPQRTETNLYNI
jgi:thymidylate kinase